MKALKHANYTFPQAGYPYMDTHRSGLVIGASGTGKTHWLISLLLGPLRGKHTRIWVASPSCRRGIDPLWDQFRDYVESTDWGHEDVMFDTWDEETEEKLRELVRTHGKINAELKRMGKRRLHSACLVVDDFADEPRFHSNTSLLSMIFLRGRHMGVQAITMSQRYRAQSTVARSQACWLVLFRLRNRKELEAIIEELSAVYPPKTLEKLYQAATDERHSFLYVNMLADRKEDMFSGTSTSACCHNLSLNKCTDRGTRAEAFGATPCCTRSSTAVRSTIFSGPTATGYATLRPP